MPNLQLETFAAQCVSKVRARHIREAAAEIDRLAQEAHRALIEQHRLRDPALFLAGISGLVSVNYLLGGQMVSGILETFGVIGLALCLGGGPVALFLWRRSGVHYTAAVEAAAKLNGRHCKPADGWYEGASQVRLLPGYAPR